ncbi:MAG: hypothetical protein ACREQT_03415 [Candidatus Binataceae bacterium]
MRQSFVATTESASHSTHRSASGSTFTSVACYGATDCSQGGTSASALEHMRFRGLVLLSWLCLRGLWLARIKPGLLHRPAMTFISVFVLLSLVLPFGRINKHVVGLRARDSSAEKHKERDQSAGKPSSNRTKPVCMFHIAPRAKKSFHPKHCRFDVLPNSLGFSGVDNPSGRKRAGICLIRLQLNLVPEKISLHQLGDDRSDRELQIPFLAEDIDDRSALDA